MRYRSAPHLLVITLIFIAAGCTRSGQHSDELERARHRLRPAPCSSEPAIAALAGVNPDPREVYLEDWLMVSVCNLHVLKAQSEAEQKPITLFVNGMDTKIEPSGLDHDSGAVTFILDRNVANKDLWQPLLYDPLFNRFTTINVSVGLQGGHPVSRVPQANTEARLNKLYVDATTYLWFALLVAMIVTLVLYARNSDMLRDGARLDGIQQSYSLARTQMAWWFCLIVIGFVFIWIVTSDRDTIPPSLLGMMGISAATGIAAVAIGSSASSAAQRKSLFDDEIASIDQALQQIAADLAEADKRATAQTPILRAALEKKTAELEQRRSDLVLQRANQTAISVSSGFWTDLVKDDRGVFAFDRFQMVVWSLVLGGIFLGSVLWELTMPEFNATLLALMGISSGTYIGFKLPQR